MASVILGLCFRSPVPAGAPGSGWPEENRLDGINDELLLEHAMESSPATCHRKDSVVIRFLGDVMLQVLMHSHIAQEEDRFTIEDVVDMLAHKLVRRHPHVFGDRKALTPEEGLASWEEIKKQEKEERAARFRKKKETP